MTIHVKIKLTTNLPICPSHKCTEGKVYNGYYQHTQISDITKKEVISNVRYRPVFFKAEDGELCVAFNFEYEIVD